MACPSVRPCLVAWGGVRLPGRIRVAQEREKGVAVGIRAGVGGLRDRGGHLVPLPFISDDGQCRDERGQRARCFTVAG